MRDEEKFWGFNSKTPGSRRRRRDNDREDEQRWKDEEKT